MSLVNKLKGKVLDESYALGSLLCVAGTTIDGLVTMGFLSQTGVAYEANPIMKYLLENGGINETLALTKIALPLATICGVGYINYKNLKSKKFFNYALGFSGVAVASASLMGDRLLAYFQYV